MDALVEISRLARQLSQHGQTVTLQRLTTGTGQTIAHEVDAKAFVRPISSGEQKKELVGSFTQTDLWIILSPVEIEKDGWTSGALGSSDQRIPVKGNKIFVAGRLRNIEGAHGFYMKDTLVRIELQARG
jgi:hypothetical protein